MACAFSSIENGSLINMLNKKADQNTSRSGLEKNCVSVSTVLIIIETTMWLGHTGDG